MKGDITYLKGKGFDANPQNINKHGRPRKQLSVILSEVESLGYTRPARSEIIEMCGLLLSLSKEELERIEKSNEFPMIMKIIASRLLSGKGFETVEKILDRTYGKTLIQGNQEQDRIMNIVIQDNDTLTEEQEFKIVQEYLRKKNIAMTSIYENRYDE